MDLGDLKVAFPLLVANEFYLAEDEAADVFMIEAENFVEDYFYLSRPVSSAKCDHQVSGEAFFFHLVEMTIST